MAGGRRKRAMRCSIPHNRFYLVEWDINDLMKSGLIADPALRLWLILKGLSWELGRCDPTDEWLADWMGGAVMDTVRRARYDLREMHLLLEHVEAGHRWLTPLPITRGLRGKLPEPLVAETEAAEEALRALIQQVQEIAGAAFTPTAVGVNSISFGERVKQQQHFSDSEDRKSVVDVEDVGVRVVIRGERGAGGEAGAGAHPQRDALAAYLERLGAFPPVANKLARKMLARMSYGEARAHAQAHRLALLKNPPEGKELPRDELVRLWVTRLRYGTRSEPQMLAHGRLLAQLDADQEGDPWSGDDLPDLVEPEEDGEEASSEAGAPEAGASEAGAPGARASEAGASEAGASGAGASGAEASGAGPTVECVVRGETRVLTVGELWLRALDALHGQMMRAAFERWLAGSRGVDLAEDGRLVVEVASEQAVEMLTVRLVKVVARAVASLVGRELGVVYRVRDTG